jgi:hypothetical protein
MCFGGGGGDGGAGEREAERRARVKDGMTAINYAFDQFDEPFYQKTRDAYRAYTQPQFDRQVDSAGQQLEFALSRGGQRNSSVGAKQRADMAFDVGTQRQAIADQGEDVVRRQRQGVEDTRQSLVSQLQADADAGAATNAAAARYTIANQTPVFSPVGEMFRNVGRTLATATGGEGMLPTYRGAGGSARLFG